MTDAPKWWTSYFFPAWDSRNLAFYRVIFYALAATCYWDLDDAPWTQVAGVLWMPVSLFRLFPGQPVAHSLLQILQVVWKLSLVAAAVGIYTRIATTFAALAGIFLLGLPNCFGKINHMDSFVVMMLVVFACSYCGDALTLWPDKKTPVIERRLAGEYGWPVRFGQVIFLLIFLAAGVSKLKNAGLAWVSSENLRFLLLSHQYTHHPPTDLARLLAQHNELVALAAGLTLTCELAAGVAIFYQPIRPFVISGLIVMQLLIALSMGVYFTPYVLGYALFLPSGTLTEFNRWVARRSVRQRTAQTVTRT